MSTRSTPRSELRRSSQAAYGFGMQASSGSWYQDMMTLFGALAVVDNNGPGAVGGGGAPLQPLAPPIGN